MLWILGLLWSMFAPLLLLLLAMPLVAICKRAGMKQRLAVGIAFSVVIIPTAIIFGIDRSAFNAECRRLGPAQIKRQMVVEGIHLDSPTSNSFGMRYVEKGAFLWMEAEDIYDRSGWVRYERQPNGTIETKKIPALTATVTVRESWSRSDHFGSISTVEIIERAAGEVLATASRAHFSGGRLKAVLGAWGSGDCPDGTGGGGSDFRRFYDLALETLLSPKAAPQAAPAVQSNRS